MAFELALQWSSFQFNCQISSGQLRLRAACFKSRFSASWSCSNLPLPTMATALPQRFPSWELPASPKSSSLQSCEHSRFPCWSGSPWLRRPKVSRAQPIWFPRLTRQARTPADYDLRHPAGGLRQSAHRSARRCGPCGHFPVGPPGPVAGPHHAS